MIRWFLGCSWRMVFDFKKKWGGHMYRIDFFCGLDSCTLRHLWQLHLCTLWHNTPLLHTLVLAFFFQRCFNVTFERNILQGCERFQRTCPRAWKHLLCQYFLLGGGCFRVFWKGASRFSDIICLYLPPTSCFLLCASLSPTSMQGWALSHKKK